MNYSSETKGIESKTAHFCKKTYKNKQERLLLAMKTKIRLVKTKIKI